MDRETNYLAVFYSDKNGPKWQKWHSYSKEEYDRQGAIGVAAVKAWEKENSDNIVYVGGPLGSTLQFCEGVIAPFVNQLTVFIVVKATSHEAATKLLQNHPHITHFPCHAVDVMPILG